MDHASPYPDEAIRTLLGIEAVPEEIRGQLEHSAGGTYTVRCTALQAAVQALPEEARHSMSEEQLVVLMLGVAAAGEADPS
ncbi:hypothetical protein SA2016_4111 (plasmid) [Sinomonas atrocyanea]|uniref:Uncharacterized protein n=1 Tax=Sinomonas atrocyanea TaxID=37927 RepID=A0A127A616_9MICC|nr:hypothetical protein [Sinomonas atrocyanea]AMM34763.1 hypothetical protein SA2016_4111 [Sinomonas atrocyanea]GEB66236.1 hypothetical protein SAT01_36840 [Sinomonas atrocyanea]